MRYFILICFTFLLFEVNGQSISLANQYYQTGEYEKAAKMYKKLFEKKGKNDYYFNKYIQALLSYEAFDEAESAIKDEIKRRPTETQLYVYYGNLYDKKGDEEQAKKQFKRAIDNMPANVGVISKMGSSFSSIGKSSLAIDVYERGHELMNDNSLFAYNLALLYQREGEKDKMIDNYLNSTAKFEKNLNTLMNSMNRTLEKDDFPILQAKIYERLKEEDAPEALNELLQWTFITNKQYKKAFRQARALERKIDGDGSQVMKIANIAYNDSDYDTAIDAYTYIIDQGEHHLLFLDAKRGLLNSKKHKILSNPNYGREELLSLEAEYNSFLKAFGKNRETVKIIHEFANVEALYLDKIDTAIVLLQSIIDLGDVTKYEKAAAKLDLADYLLINGDRWESTLLYSQVDKEMKEAEQGEQARFRNAMLSYYNGDFEWAQEQFDILKRATSRLISNDAIDMSVFIMDNLGLDTTDVPLKMFSQSDLFIFQNKYDEAFQILDDIELQFPDHGLKDDILYRKANMYSQRRKYDKAEEYYLKVIKDYPEEIRTDNAMYELAELYENVLDQKDKAKSLYERIFLEYTNSTFAVEARKRYRILRGDEI